MNLPAVHNCLRLSDENDLLLRKLKKMRFKNEQLEAELTRMQEQLRLQQLMRDYVMTRDSQVQTESQLWCGRGGGIKEPKGASGNKNGKLLQMYNNLQKRYDNEIKRNQVQSEAITSLTVKIHELELQLQVANQKMQQLECKKVCKHTQTILKDLLLVIEKLKKEREKLYKEKRMLLKELAGLDKEFFDEIEDLKFALQESVKLNNQYEKCLNQISTKFGLPCAEISEVPVT
ncbi:uncharacterized protein LOC115460315 isoform X2 [Microcaecilia unicolor]|uniref:Uncharacterized protein LOC115460315 isoform X2 n=1 Tax=Microcaecilia unicolor TaxID=1415580 RepID=A0A6P7X0E2_9AMPH|nr:uncharacterized protein LOC115460315 isoform X2 [Microcaecilia unicolor]